MKLKQYPKYKHSGVQWIGEIPENWSIHKIKYLLKTPVTDGPHETPEFIDEGIPFLSVDSIQNGEIIFENTRFISEEDHIKYKVKCNPKRNDVFMRKAASIGKIARVKVDFPFSIWSPLALLRANKKIKPTFFEYVLKSDYSQDQIDNFSTSNTQKNISMDDIPRIQLILPNDILEQKEIISFLDSKTQNIDQTIEKDKKLIELLKEKRIALINHVVTKGLDKNAKMKDSKIDWIGDVPDGWEVRKMKFIADITRGAILRPVDEPDYFDDEGHWFYLNISDATKCDKYLHKSKLKLSKLGSTKSARVKKDNLIITASATIGIPFINKVDVCIHDGFIPFKNLKVNIEFLYYYLTNKVLYSSLGKLNTQTNIYLDEVKEMVLVFPNKQEQLQIVQYLDKQTTKIDQTISKIQEKIILMEEYKKSLIHHIVTGKVDVRGIEI